MNVASTSETVRSKYFSAEHAMDESLSDFQETKKSSKGPKTVQKPSKPKTRKVKNQPKGQKDIRTVLNAKKNELVKYNKEFDNICKQSGVDVDSEQLQLAIALSKSLQTDECSGSEVRKTLTSQERVAKIRTTLKEYGFKVPEAKITVSKKIKKHRKQYRLINITEEERHQKITARYSQVLFENLVTRLDCNNPDSHQDLPQTLYYIATNLAYEYMKDNDIFYVDKLLDKSITSGSLLKDWSEIPGRPVTPNLFETIKMNISEIACSQDELDVILSGSIKAAKDIFADKHDINKENIVVPTLVIDDEENDLKSQAVNTPYLNNEPIQNHEDYSQTEKNLVTGSIKEVLLDEQEDILDIETNNMLTATHIYRSCSPDMFDDEPSVIVDSIKPINILSQGQRTKVFTEDDSMDLTECANNVLSQHTNKELILIQDSEKNSQKVTKYIQIPHNFGKSSQNVEDRTQLSQNITKRKSDDFMEITSCIAGSSQQNQQVAEIDLTQHPEVSFSATNYNKLTDDFVRNNQIVNESLNVDCLNTTTEDCDLNFIDRVSNANLNNVATTHIDLTQKSNDDNIVTEIEENEQRPNNKNHESMDLTQSSNSNESMTELPEVDVGNTQNSLNDTVILDEGDYLEANGKVKKSVIPQSVTKSKVVDLTQGSHNQSIDDNDYGSINKDNNSKSCNQSFFEHFVHDHSGNSKETGNSTGNFMDDKNTNETDDIDLTQSSGTSETSDNRRVTAIEIPNKSSLGKRDDISIDYDEVCDDSVEDVSKNIVQISHIDHNSGNETFVDVEIINELPGTSTETSKSINYDKDTSENQNLICNSSQTSEFNLSDKELNYSIHQSRFEIPGDNFDFGGISVLDDISRNQNKKSLGETSGVQSNATLCDSFLPEVNIKRSQETKKPLEIEQSNGALSPKEVCSTNDVIPIKTPKNTEFLVKTDEVTPMLDYASMTTPQRNRELDRYGLKPFKRKRAIQILTHLYNQTHPLVQSCADEDQPSPSKKPRQDNYSHTEIATTKFDTKMSPSKNSQTSLSSIGRSKSNDNNDLKSPRKGTSISPIKIVSILSNNDIALSNIDDLEYTSKSPRKGTSISPIKRVSTSSNNDVALSNNTSKSPRKVTKSPRKVTKAPRKLAKSPSKGTSISPIKRISNDIGPSSNNLDDLLRCTDKENEAVQYDVTSEVPVIKNIECNPDDWVFQKREKAKLHSCRVPLHIAFHNYVSSRRGLREAILKYEPINIDVIHKELVSYGHRYDPKELLRFLDKKCITVKTTDNNARNNKR